MKIYFSLISLFFISCNSQTEHFVKNYRFSNFKNTIANELAAAVKEDNKDKVVEIITQQKIPVDFVDPKYKMSLLCLSITNNKRNAFLGLIESGANVNLLCGEDRQFNAVSLAVEYTDDCDSFYLQHLFEKGGNAKAIVYKENGRDVTILPLFKSISLTDENGNSCMNIPKLLLENGATLEDKESDRFSDRKIDIIEYCLIHTELDFLNYLLIEKKIKAPKIAMIYGGLSDEPEQMTITEALQSEPYTQLIDEGAKIKVKRILNYLKKTGQR